MKLLLAIIPRRALNLVFVSNYYDGPLAGLCRLNGTLCAFSGISKKRFKVYSLNIAEKLELLLDKWTFEVCVGRHWSYPRVVAFRIRQPKWFFAFLANAFYAIKNGTEYRQAFKP